MISYAIKGQEDLQLLLKVYNYLNKTCPYGTTFVELNINKGRHFICNSVYQYIYRLGRYYGVTMTPYFHSANAGKICRKIFSCCASKWDYVVLDGCGKDANISSYESLSSFNNIENKYNDNTPRVECTDIKEFVDFYNWLYGENIEIKGMERDLRDLLEPGVIVRFDKSGDDKYGLVSVLSNGDLYILQKDGWIQDRFSSDLTYPVKSWDIVALYKPSEAYGFDNIFECVSEKDCIWKREPKVVELTLDEIAKKFNISVEQLKIKK